MRASQQARFIPGGKSNTMHDRACLCLKNCAAKLIQRVHPLEYVEPLEEVMVERPIYADQRPVNFVDLFIAAREVNQPDRLPHWPAEWGPRPQRQHAFLVEVKTWREPILDVLRQVKYQRALWESEQIYVQQYRFAHGFYDGGVNGRASLEYFAPNWVASADELAGATLHWVLATTYRTTDAERKEFEANDLVIVDLFPDVISRSVH
jgi:hypothetical protein